MSWIKVLAINVFLTLALIGLLLLSPPLIVGAYRSFKAVKTAVGYPETRAEDPRASLDLYKGYDWTATHFRELHQQVTTYKDWVVWQRGDFAGQTINIVDGIRVSVDGADPASGAATFWFFGGSTTWGTGVSDAFTYPSIFSVVNGVHVKNFGMEGYSARQSLARLTNVFAAGSAYTDVKNIHAVFYDGANDVAQRCRYEVKGLASGRQALIQSYVNDRMRFDKWAFKRTFGQVIDSLEEISNNVRKASHIADSGYYACAENPERAREVAETLVNTWQVASDLMRARGGEFTAILQPVALQGEADTGYLNLTAHRILAKEYAAVYPLIREIAEDRDIDFIDLSATYDGCTDCYIDFCHVGPQAHERLVQAMSAHFFK